MVYRIIFWLEQSLRIQNSKQPDLDYTSILSPILRWYSSLKFYQPFKALLSNSNTDVVVYHYIKKEDLSLDLIIRLNAWCSRRNLFRVP